MDYSFYLEQFQSALSKVNRKEFDKQHIHLFTGVVLNSVVIKAYKPEWANDLTHPVTAGSRVFFSVWVTDNSIRANKLCYNIHALKLREWKGYKIASRDFATRFRKAFQSQIKNWPHASIAYGPLTLMEGWQELHPAALQQDVATLVNDFLSISPIIDKTLEHYKI